jgi:nicotinamidase-related amidase
VQPSTSSSCSEVLLMAGVWTEVCLAQTALSALEDGYTSTS